jgi:hypothetical protein
MNGVCTANGTRRTCPDITCHTGYCASETGDCVYTLSEPGTPCIDGLAYTTMDQCYPNGNCIGTNVTCNDNNPCTDDRPNEDTGLCMFTPNNLVVNTGNSCVICTCSAETPGELLCTDVQCSNGVYCDGEEYCDPEQGCRYVEPVDCSSFEDLCSSAYCSEEFQSCITVPLDIIGQQCGFSDVGECSYGTYNCSTQLGISCVGATYPQLYDVCDGLDRNCDGIVNETCDYQYCYSPFDCQTSAVCRQSICLYNNTCVEYSLDHGSCQPDEEVNNPCVLSYSCTYGFCLPSSTIQCDIPEGYAPECVNRYCSNSTGECVLDIIVTDPYDLFTIPCNVEDSALDGFCGTNGTCVPVEPNCDDGNSCTLDEFSSIYYPYCTHTPLVGESCVIITDACLVNTTCSEQGTCEGISRDVISIDEGGCYDPTQQNNCTQSVCINVGTYPDYLCTVENIREGEICNDSLNCTVIDTCSSGQCIGSVSKDCNTVEFCGTNEEYDSAWNRQCVSFTCDESSGGLCLPIFSSNTCDDDLFCTVNDTCSLYQDGECTGPPRLCAYDPIINAGFDEECLEFYCDEQNDICAFYFPQHRYCTNVDPCVEYSECRCGQCQPVAVVCDDGNPCNGEEICSNGECISGIPILCDDSNICTDDYCDPLQNGTCVNTPNSMIGINCGSNTTLGECEIGTLLCNPSSGLYCNGSISELPSEDCGPDGTGDGKDNDCNGYVDDGCTAECITDSDCLSNLESLNVTLPLSPDVIVLCAHNMTCVFIQINLGNGNCTNDTISSSSSLSSSSSSYYYYSLYDDDDDDDYNNSTSSSNSSSSSSQNWYSYLQSYFSSSSSSSSSDDDDEDDDNGGISKQVLKRVLNLFGIDIHSIFGLDGNNNSTNNYQNPYELAARDVPYDQDYSSFTEDFEFTISTSSETFEVDIKIEIERTDDYDYPSYADDDELPNCEHGWVDAETLTCRCKFGWQGDDCDDCITHQNEQYIYMCERMGLKSAYHPFTYSYRLVLLDVEFLDAYFIVSSNTSSNTTVEDVDSLITTTSSLTLLIDTQMETEIDDDDDDDDDDEFSLNLVENTSEKTFPSNINEYLDYAEQMTSYYNVNPSNHTNSTRYDRYIRPGTEGLSCTCQTEDEEEIYDIYPYARCAIKHIDLDLTNNNGLGTSTIIAIVISVAVGIIFICFIILLVVLAVYCGNRRSRPPGGYKFQSEPLLIGKSLRNNSGKRRKPSKY